MWRNLYTFSPALDNKSYDQAVAHVGKIYITKSTCETCMSRLKNMYIPELVSSKAEGIKQMSIFQVYFHVKDHKRKSSMNILAASVLKY